MARLAPVSCMLRVATPLVCSLVHNSLPRRAEHSGGRARGLRQSCACIRSGPPSQRVEPPASSTGSHRSRIDPGLFKSEQTRGRLVHTVKEVAPKSELYSLVEPFGRPQRSRAVVEILETFIPYLALSVLMVITARRGHPWVTLALSGLAAGFLVRVFIIFHDCCHGSFFRSRRANRVVGYAAGLLTLTPFDKWQRSHAEHHATVGDLDRRGVGDVWTLTTSEFLAASKPKRLFYRVFRNPFIMLGVGPAAVFVITNRFSGRGASRRERFSVHFTNAAIVVAIFVAHFTIGLPALLLTQVPTLLLAGAVGVW